MSSALGKLLQLRDSVRAYLTGLSEVFTPHFFTFLTIGYLLLKGMVYTAMAAVQLPYYRDVLGLDGEQYQKLQNVTMMAWAMKPLIGVLSDSVPIMGYHKRYYMALFCFLISVPLGVANMAPAEPSSANFVTVMFFLNMLGLAGFDNMCEGKYSEIMAADQSGRGSGIVSWIWGLTMVGGAMGSGLEGPFADTIGPRLVVWVLLPIGLFLIAPTLLGWMPEHKVVAAAAIIAVPSAETSLLPQTHSAADLTADVTEDLQSAAFKQTKRRMVIFSIALSLAALGDAIVSILATNVVVLAYNVVIVAILMAWSFHVLPAVVARANIFGFCMALLYINITGALAYFYVASPQCVQDAPHFSFTYYQTVGGIAGSFGGLLGAFAFQRLFITWTFRSAVLVTLGLYMVASLFDLIIVSRWNVAVGIPDKATFLFGDSIVYPMAQMLNFMPMTILISRLCPKGMESTVFALLAGFANFGQTMSATVGYMVIGWFKIDTVAPCDFTNLPLLIALCHIACPLLIVPCTLLLPKLRINDAEGAIALLAGTTFDVASAPAEPEGEQDDALYCDSKLAITDDACDSKRDSQIQSEILN